MIYPQEFVQTHVQAPSYLQTFGKQCCQTAHRITEFHILGNGNLFLLCRSKAIPVLMVFIYITSWIFHVFMNKAEVLVVTEVF